MAKPVRAILFDIGRVLVRVDVGRAMQGLSKGLTLSPAEIWTAIEKDPRWPDWQEGRMTARDWHLHIQKRLGTALDFSEFSEAWNRALDPQPVFEDAFFAGLRKKYKIGLLSNTDPIHVAHLEATFSFFRYFPASVRTYSCTAKASKPDPVIFRSALKALKAAAEETVYVDDVPKYVEAAARLGMRGIAFESREQLLGAFAEAGIALPPAADSSTSRKKSITI